MVLQTYYNEQQLNRLSLPQIIENLRCGLKRVMLLYCYLIKYSMDRIPSRISNSISNIEFYLVHRIQSRRSRMCENGIRCARSKMEFDVDISKTIFILIEIK